MQRTEGLLQGKHIRTAGAIWTRKGRPKGNWVPLGALGHWTGTGRHGLGVAGSGDGRGLTPDQTFIMPPFCCPSLAALRNWRLGKLLSLLAGRSPTSHSSTLHVPFLCYSIPNPSLSSSCLGFLVPRASVARSSNIDHFPSRTTVSNCSFLKEISFLLLTDVQP